MKVTPTALDGVLRIELQEFRDTRGSFVEVFNEARFAEHGLPSRFRQHNVSRSRSGALRGLHFQLRHPQGKLIRCSRGRVLDVAADVRVGAPTFGRWVAMELSEAESTMLWIPPGFAHGFCALSELTEVEYLCTELYQPSDDRGILWCDAELAIAWPIKTPILSDRDRALPTLAEARRLGALPRFSPAVT